MSDETTPDEVVEEDEVDTAAAGPLGETVNDDGSVTIATADGEEVGRIPSMDEVAAANDETVEEVEEETP